MHHGRRCKCKGRKFLSHLPRQQEQTELMYFPRENMNNIVKLLTDWKSEWKRHLGTNYPISFSQVKLTLGQIWLKFISTRICPVINMSNIDMFQVTLFMGF
ncbi:hypothetical protein J1N35_028922 [Gossypium stocksii]|uniref:Uncharacterized protein n=1 Tax=Gossypium stocksii TaxID=47602 RepID=A0A9D3UXA1_9ROSI|nr:hypothetical protein J1N35_028922 [Gossypium stocksii]